MTETAGAVAVVEHKQTVTEIVNEATGAQYTPAYVAAMKELLPPEFHNAASLIALGVRARKSGLDPFTEIHAWKNERGTLQFQIARDGFIYIAAADPRVESLEFQHVYEGEEFSWRKDEDGKVAIVHSGGLVKGKLLGAYCVAHMADDHADHMEMRTVDNYSHLMSKANWKYLPEMLITRVIGSCVRLVCPDRAGGLYSEADRELPEGLPAPSAPQADMQAKTSEMAARLRGQRTWEDAEAEAAEVVEAEVVEAEVVAPVYTCPECERWFDTQQGLAGHMRVHKTDVEPAQPIGEAEPDTVPTPPSDADQAPSESDATDSPPTTTSSAPDTSGAKEDEVVAIPEGYTVYKDGDVYEVVTPDGEILEGVFPTFNDAGIAADNHFYAQERVANDARTPVRLADVYAWTRSHGLKAAVVSDLINDGEYADEFGRFRDEGAELINPFNLDGQACALLLELIQQDHGE